MKTKFFFLIALSFMFAFANRLNAQSASNFSNPGTEYQKAPFTLKVKRHDGPEHITRFNAHRKANGNGNIHPYISKRRKNQKQTMSLNKKHKRQDHGDRAPRTW